MAEEIGLPASLADLLTDTNTLNAMFDALGPEQSERLDIPLEFEVEVEGGSTFRIAYKKGALKGKKGFARGDPFAAFLVSEASYAAIVPLLQDALAGFPASARLSKQLSNNRALKRAELQKLYETMDKLPALRIDMTLGSDVVVAARGPVDVATTKLSVAFPADAVARARRGEAAPPTISGELGAKTQLLAALAPLLPGAV